jgi:hypothetical protein
MQSQLRDLGGGEVLLMAAVILLMAGVSLLMRIEKNGASREGLPPGSRGASARAYLDGQFGPASGTRPGDTALDSGQPIAVNTPIRTPENADPSGQPGRPAPHPA